MFSLVKKFIYLFIALFLLVSFSLYSQDKQEADNLKKNALNHMQNGRFGEAIDQLNKYISLRPRESDGYNLRAECFEKRSEFSNAILDYRRAIAVESSDAGKKSKYENNLKRTQQVYYAILLKKIDGHLREIAINPNNPFDYLEIGKAYRQMEIWDKAEEWYDKYIAMDPNASPDEIIRYTEILAKTGSIVKGEKILKIYTERYPGDWRLQSRYGYFTLWLGKYPIAKKAFETALSFKPFFKEAQDGLDIVNREAYVTQEDPRAFEKEYPIDKYYRLLRSKPQDLESRFKLVDELIKAERIEEAYQQLQIIGLNNSSDPRYIEKWDYVTNYRTTTYREKIDYFNTKLEQNPKDKESLKKIAEYYEYLQAYDTATVYLEKYFEEFPDEKDPALRYKYARITAWNRDFTKSLEILDGLIQEYPNNIDYQLFRAQISVWTNQDIELARGYLENALKARPNSVEALISMGSLKLIDRDYDAAQEYANKAKEIDPNNEDVGKLQSNIDWQKMRAEEEKLYQILEEGRGYVMNDDCAGALPYYEEYMSKAEPNVLVNKEYGDVLFCAKQYNAAIDQYNLVLSQTDDYDAKIQRAKVYFVKGDSLLAVNEFRSLVMEDSADFDANLYLGDSYAKIGEPDSARATYNHLLSWDLDSTQIKQVEMRKGWLPITGLAALFETFPNYVSLAPSGVYYADNLGFRIGTFGSRLELGLTSFLSIGASFYKTYLRSNYESLNADVIQTLYDNGINFVGNRDFTTFKGHLFIRLSKYLNLGVGSGSANSSGAFIRKETDAFIRFDRPDTLSIVALYQNSDASLILYSPYLIDLRLYAKIYKLEGYYQHYNGLKIMSSFNYLSVTDGNEGNDFYLRIGKYFYRYLIVGYEYMYTNYKLKSQYYYSPTNFEAHNLWVENDLEKNKELTVTIGGKLGYIPLNDFVLFQGYLDVKYQVYERLNVAGRIAAGSTSRDDSSYRYFSGQVGAYWSIF